jgi:hypothetical protein
VDLPEVVIERMIESLRGGLPASVAVERPYPSVLRFHVEREEARLFDYPVSIRWATKLGVRNRDGVHPYSIAFAWCFVLDALVHMARKTGVPWRKADVQHIVSYAEPIGGSVHGWLVPANQTRIEFPPISLTRVEPSAPIRPKLPFPLLARYRLPTAGPVQLPTRSANR